MNRKAVQDILIGIIIIFVLAAVLLMDVMFIIKDFSRFQSGGFGWMPTNRVGILTGVYVQLWGLLFLGSYFLGKESFLFRGISSICQNLGSPRSRKTALFTGILSLVLGTIALIAGLFGYYI